MKWIRIGLITLSLGFAAAGSLEAQRFGVQGNWSDDFDFGVGGRVELPLPNLLTSEGALANTFLIGSFDYFFPDCGDSFGGFDFDCSYWEINAGLAVPIVSSSIDPYVGAGLNLARFSSEFESDLPGVDDDASETEVGLNLLGGLRFPLGGLSAFGEARLELGGGEQFVLTFGVLLGGADN